MTFSSFTLVVEGGRPPELRSSAADHRTGHRSSAVRRRKTGRAAVDHRVGAGEETKAARVQINATDEIEGKFKFNSDRLQEFKAFDETKAGVKGLDDQGIHKIPTLFHNPPHNFSNSTNSTNTQYTIPIIDLRNISEDPNARQNIISKVKEAYETWGFFQVVNHAIPLNLLEDMKKGVLRFFEQDTEVKKEMYTRDQTRPLIYNSNFDLYSSPALNWRDILMDYGNNANETWNTRAFGAPGTASPIGSGNGMNNVLISKYMGSIPTEGKNSTSEGVEKVTIFGGLQVLHDDKWIYVPPIPKALVVNIGDLMQASSLLLFCYIMYLIIAYLKGLRAQEKLYGPIKELLSEDNPPKYYVAYFSERGLDGISALPHYKL
ncbi:hypothetical protein QL285_081983 [Trifolium repens]|nr:hypothetical protein QL285_081983 [Trifolium repens]